MIHVDQRPEYAAFDREVRVPGRKFLQNNPTPSNRDFRGHAYWNRAKSKLRDTYRHCAYTSRRVRGDDVSVDHFRPKVNLDSHDIVDDPSLLHVAHVSQRICLLADSSGQVEG